MVLSSPDTDEMLMMMHPTKKREHIIITNLILFSRFLITIVLLFR
jgi:hypothetical protein